MTTMALDGPQWAAYETANRRANKAYLAMFCPCGGLVRWIHWMLECDECGTRWKA